MYQNIYTPIQHLRRPLVNPGGLCWTVYARRADVLVWPEVHPATGLAYTDIQLADGANWYQLKLVNKDKFFTQVKKDTPAGPAWDMQVAGYMGGTTNDHVLSLATMAFEDFVVVFKDRSGQVRFIGNEDKGAYLNDDYNSGDADSGRKTNLQFVWQHAASAPIYTGSTDIMLADTQAPPLATGDFNSDFTNDFSH